VREKYKCNKSYSCGIITGFITKLKDGGMTAQMLTTDVLIKFSLNPTDLFLRCTAASVIRKVIARVKLRGPNPIVNATRISVSVTTIFEKKKKMHLI